jgi:hypothetical protein
MSATPEELSPVPRLEFTLSQSNLGEGGRERRGEAYLNLNQSHQALIPRGLFRALTDAGTVLDCRASGSPSWDYKEKGRQNIAKNLRSVPGADLGAWLRNRQAKAGDKVYAHKLEPGLWLLRHVRVDAPDARAQAQRTAEAFSWDAVFDATRRSNTPPTGDQPGESHFYRGSGRRGAR